MALVNKYGKRNIFMTTAIIGAFEHKHFLGGFQNDHKQSPVRLSLWIGALAVSLAERLSLGRYLMKPS